MIKSEIILIIIFVIIILVILFCSCFYFFKKWNSIKPHPLNEIHYYRCFQKPLTYMLSKIVEDNKWIHDLNNWNLYIPCGYNHVENELKNLDISLNPHNPLYIFAINGSDLVAGKNSLWDNLEKYYGRGKASQLVPESWVLINPLHKKHFYESGFVANQTFIFKKNIQRKQGILLTNHLPTINSIWNNPHEYKIIQKYINNPLLINGYKLNLRLYLYIVVSNGKREFYLYPDAKCIYTKEKYDKDSIDFEKNITSFNFDISIYKQNPRDFQLLKEYLKKSDFKEIEVEAIWGNIENLFIDVCRVLTINLSPSKNLEVEQKEIKQFQLFGCDILLDDNLKPYLLELNKGPDMSPKDDIDEEIKYDVMTNMFYQVGLIKEWNKKGEFKKICEF